MEHVAGCWRDDGQCHLQVIDNSTTRSGPNERASQVLRAVWEGCAMAVHGLVRKLNVIATALPKAR